jgi:hypothetical protein
MGFARVFCACPAAFPPPSRVDRPWAINPTGFNRDGIKAELLLLWWLWFIASEANSPCGSLR